MGACRPSRPNSKSFISLIAQASVKKDPYTLGAAAPRGGKCPFPAKSEDAALWRMANQDEEARRIVQEYNASTGGN